MIIQYHRYSQLLAQYILEVSSAIDPPPDYTTKHHCLHDSEILNSLWTTDEKERFFTAIARCGKGNLAEVAKRIGTKSLAQVTAYVGLLDEATAWNKQSSKRKRFFDLAKIPAAVEVDDSWVEFEEKAANACGKKEVDSVIRDIEEGTFVLDVQKANELAQWYQKMFPHKKIDATLSAETIIEFENQIKEITRRLIQTTIFLADSFARNSRKVEGSLCVSISDVRTAVDILSLPRHFRRHFSTLPTRMGPFGTTFTGNEKQYYGKSGVKRKIEATIDDTEAALICGDVARNTSRVSWPPEWEINKGFNWDVHSEAEDQHEVEDQMLTDSDLPYASDEEHTSNGPDDGLSTPQYSERLHRKYRIVKEEDTLLSAETGYLDAVDSQRQEIELNYLNNYVKQGQRVARRSREEAIQTLNFTSSKQTKPQIHKQYQRMKEHKKVWDTIRRRFTLLFGPGWADYKRDIVSIEGAGWERPAQEWEVIEKHEYTLSS